MKTIGMVGGVGWESTVIYYQIINEMVEKELGGLHSARTLLYSIDFAEIEQYQTDGDWERGREILAEATRSLEKAGVDFTIICINTMHRVVPQMQWRIQIPILHITEATATELLHHNIRKITPLDAKYTMTQEFYKGKLTAAGIETLIPDVWGIETINDITYQGLCLGIIPDISQKEYLSITDQLAVKGAQGAILGCTEIGLSIQQKDTSLPVPGTTQVHAKMAVMEVIG